MTCRKCIHFAVCSKDEQTRYYGKEIACGNVEELCQHFQDKSALEKQIPKKVEVIDKNYGYYSCKVCGAITPYKTYKYCAKCGQALDWSDTE